MRRFTFLKGHATLNDFVVIEDHHGMQDLEPAFVRELCNRRGGIGADGVLRVVRAQHVRDWAGDPGLWFMDYRNADGSVAEMCGNGLRLFARHLMNEQLVPTGRFRVATRAGAKDVRIAVGGMISVDIGAPTFGPEVEVTLGSRRWGGVAVDVGNPHAVVEVAAGELDDLDLATAPAWSPEDAFPAGANVEFIHEVRPGHIAMRVHERGSGETMSCGTGVAASAAAHRRHLGETGDGVVTVTVPGGDLQVEFDGDRVWLTGPAVINMRGEYWA